MVTAEQRVRAALERIAADRSGAVVTVREQAIDEARMIDEARARGLATGPLAGLPFTAKDVLATVGTRTTAGSRLLAEHVPVEDAPAVARLRKAGAVLVGKTNCFELALTAWTGNPLFGETAHPHARGHSPGGSSGGCAAAIAAGLVTMSVGTHYGGSVRFPAACCRVVGLRPTPGRIDSRGQLPQPPDDSPRARFSLVGPLGRRVEDVVQAFSVLDPSTLGRVSVPPRSVGIHPGLAEIAKPLRRLGVEAAEADPAWLRDAEETFTELRALDTFNDLRPSAERLGDDLQKLIEAAPTEPDPEARRCLDRRADDHRAQALEFLERHRLLIAPVAHIELPPPAGEAPDPEALGPCRAITLLGLPALSVAGAQIVDRPGDDESVLALGGLLERHLPSAV